MISSSMLMMCIFISSDEDIDVKALVKSWLHDQPEEQRHIEGWIEDYFYKALDWVLKRNDFVVETTLVGVVMNGLSHLKNTKTKPEFVCALLRGLGSNLNTAAKSDLAKEVKINIFLKCD